MAGGGDFRTATRIAVYGVTGSGKTRAATTIGAVTGLPWHAVDDLTWEPGWVEVPRDDQRRRIERICRGDAWILDSIYSTWMDVVLDRVEVIVALDYPRWLSYGRLLRRTVTRMVTREPVCNGNVESLRTLLSRDSILWFHFRSFGRKRRRIRAWEDDPAAPEVQRFTGPRQLALALTGPAPRVEPLPAARHAPGEIPHPPICHVRTWSAPGERKPAIRRGRADRDVSRGRPRPIRVPGTRAEAGRSARHHRR